MTTANKQQNNNMLMMIANAIYKTNKQPYYLLPVETRIDYFLYHNRFILQARRVVDSLNWHKLTIKI